MNSSMGDRGRCSPSGVACVFGLPGTVSRIENTMKQTISLLLGWLMVGATTAQGSDVTQGAARNPPTSDAALAVLRRADEAAKAVKSVRYKGHYTASARNSSGVREVRGTVLLTGGFSRGLQKFLVDAKVRYRDTEEVKRFTAGGNGEEFFMIDWQDKVVHADMDPQVIGTDGRIAQRIAMVEFVHPSPFSHEITGKSAELRPSATVDGEPCHVVHVVYGIGAGQQAVWYFSKADHLPRRVERSWGNGGRGRTSDLIVTELEIDPKFDEGELKLDMPEGFKKTDEFAPNRTALR